MSRTPNQIGDDLEDRVQRRLGGERVKQSGGGRFWKLDVKGGTFIWSCKATEKSYLRVTTDMFREAMRAARGIRGTGDGVRAGVITEVDGKAIVSIDLEDFADIMTGDIEPYLAPSKARERRLRARQ
jgi:hypothetical protein